MTFHDWLNTPGLFRCVIVELDYIDNEQTKTAYFANCPFVSSGSDVPAHQAYQDAIVGGLEIVRTMSEVFFGKSASSISDLELVPTSFTRSLNDVENCKIKIYIGDKTWSKTQFMQVFVGVADTVEQSKDKVSIEFKDKASALDIPILTSVFTAGPSEGELLPLALGQCFNITPKLINAATHTYKFNSVQSSAVNAVKFNGDLVNPTNYTVDLIASTITFLVQPVGNITLDINGAVIGGQYVKTSNQIVNYLIGTRLGYAITFGVLPSYTLGIYIDNDTTYSDLLDQIAISIGGYWYFSRLGTFVFKQFSGTTGTANKTLRDDQNIEFTRQQRHRLKPIQNLTLGYQKNWTVLANVAARVFDTNPTLAQQLSNEQLTVSDSNAVNGLSITTPTLIANKDDAQTELARRLALKSIARYVNETEQLAAPFQWNLGDEISLETPAQNGNHAIITRFAENLLTNKISLDFWQ
ncbi:hypothetical protein [Pseudoalteromonas piratica]|uniref:Uncharacterized protein n=1 Tax=Pseudoalteromonas piratica TaxID=1348114 RepID=A0A0A7EGV7_9GAMM|nr:hypothetical protein [Pseudoalteromonas piratica]AIY65202.1 hypothetical protein OM33_08540 [Pseudoalteromonas piratica]